MTLEIECMYVLVSDTSKFSTNVLKLSCDSRFQRAFTACVFVLKVITLVGSNQRNYFENATACSKRTLKTTVATKSDLISRIQYEEES